MPATVVSRKEGRAGRGRAAELSRDDWVGLPLINRGRRRRGIFETDDELSSQKRPRRQMGAALRWSSCLQCRCLVALMHETPTCFPHVLAGLAAGNTTQPGLRSRHRMVLHRYYLCDSPVEYITR